MKAQKEKKALFSHLFILSGKEQLFGPALFFRAPHLTHSVSQSVSSAVLFKDDAESITQGQKLSIVK